jgi:hypothetical protein
MSENIPHSLGGFRGAFESEHGRKPTEQEIWNAAICSWRDLTKQKSDVAKERVVDLLLEYAGDNGYSHIDYADTMRHAAALLQSTALPVGELTPEQVRDVCMADPELMIAFTYQRTAPAGTTESGVEISVDRKALKLTRAILAAASSQPVLEPLDFEEWAAAKGIAEDLNFAKSHRPPPSRFYQHIHTNQVYMAWQYGITQGGKV